MSSSQSWKKQKEFTSQDIIDRLQGFTPMENIEQLSPGMQIRYISEDKNTKKRTLKMGGILVYIDPKGRYLRVKSMISANMKPWSVQIAGAEIYFKNKGEGDAKYTQILKHFGSEETLESVRQIFGGSEKEINRDISYIEQNYGGKLSNLVKSNYKLLQQVKQLKEENNMMKKYKERAKKLEKKLNKKKQRSSRDDYAVSPSTTTGMGMLNMVDTSDY